MRLSERILLALSRCPEAEDCNRDAEAWNLDTALSVLIRVYAPLLQDLAGKSVLDFGCGFGWQVLALALHGAGRAVGIESDPAVLEGAEQLACRMIGLRSKVEFRSALEPDLLGAFDLVLSQNAMEHFPDPAATLRAMRQALRPGGRILITFGPPWLAPYGSHMQFFTRVPWVNVLFPEKTVMAVRSHFRNDGATRYEEIRKGLNKMTLSKFERLVRSSGLRSVYWRLECVKGLDWLAKIPLLREFFVNNVSCLLVEASPRARATEAPSDQVPARLAPAAEENAGSRVT